ncbi:TXLNB family protein [Megaselia abdita]
MEKVGKSKKDGKEEELVLKSLVSSETPDQKLSQLVKRFVEVEKENKRLQTVAKQSQKSIESVVKEKENLQREYNKNVLMRDKLEEVCREQQKLIKSVKNESLQRIREEEEKRKEAQTRFQNYLTEINTTIGKNNDDNEKLRLYNIDMTKKLKHLAEQYETKEQQIDKINEQVHIEQQLHEAKLAKAQMEAALEKEILLREKQAALDDLLSCKKIIKELSEKEVLLKEQLNIYTEKYDDFQNSLAKSNTIFTTYKAEIEKMSKNTTKLERECNEWKSKWQKCNISLIELATEKKERDDFSAKCGKQVEQLQKLLRALQHERTALYSTLKENNIANPQIPPLPEEPELMKNTTPPNLDHSKTKMEMMAKNCAELKLSLASLHNEMKQISNKQAKITPAPVEPTPAIENKKKKNKNKKNKNKTCPRSSTSPENTTNETTTPASIENVEPVEPVLQNGTNSAETEVPTEKTDEEETQENTAVAEALPESATSVEA